MHSQLKVMQLKEALVLLEIVSLQSAPFESNLCLIQRSVFTLLLTFNGLKI